MFTNFILMARVERIELPLIASKTIFLTVERHPRKNWCGKRELNPCLNLGKVAFYH
jgi:hypothetical protein